MSPTFKLLVVSFLLTGVALTTHANARKKRNVRQLLTTLQGLRPLNLGNNLLPINYTGNPSNTPPLASALQASGGSFPAPGLLNNLVSGRNQLQGPFPGGPLNRLIGTAVSRLTSADSPSQTHPPEEGTGGQTGSSTQGAGGHGTSLTSQARLGIDLNGNNYTGNPSNRPPPASALQASGGSFPAPGLLNNLVSGRNQLQGPFPGGPLNRLIGTAVSRLTSADSPSQTHPPEEGTGGQTGSSTQGAGGHGSSSLTSQARPGVDLNGPGTDWNGNLLGPGSQARPPSFVRNALNRVFHGISSTRPQEGSPTNNSHHEQYLGSHSAPRPSRGQNHESGSGSSSGSSEGNHSISAGSQQHTGSSGEHEDSGESEGSDSSGGNSS